ncbi:hypothetical protein [Flaviaesturariibacter aridisoli]|uniref:Uncharacterized protein n=1 Tax=Flaviaesturariibacter aridisoli TaxID=2545761 RepID=A0A4R4E2V2_9BACT|nr:hypothetical protein [Flaviaesturariibacter aridisoli]TCZ72950.1 hypothetical protein E0486_07755 [Flaviaesturariibacter aridisoli]
MKYRVEKLSETMCSIKLVPENPSETALLAKPEQEEAFLAHYRQALSKLVHKDATLVGVVNKEHYPGHVLVAYALPEGR